MIERSERDGVVTIRLAHGKASALDVELTDGLRAALVAERDAVALVLTGTGSIFSAGVDLFRVLEGGGDYVDRFLPSLRDTIRELFLFERPVVVAANGHAIAGGGILVAAGDYRLMARGDGRVGVPELLVGVPFPAMALEVVRSALAPNRVQEAVFTGRTYAPDDAVAVGFVDEVVEPDALLERAHEIARQLGAIPREAFAITKRLLRAPAIERAEALAAVSDAAATAAWSSPATHEHVRAYLERTIRKKR